MVSSRTRDYPSIRQGLPPPRRPISFICLHYSDEFEHNILKSDCVHDPLNEFIAIENPANAFYDTLGQAMRAGLARASHDLIAAVHEDLLLLPGWQAQLEQSLAALEAVDPDWGVAGAIGWDEGGAMQGHNGGPWGVNNSFAEADFIPVVRIDEQIILLRQSSGIAFDPALPSIHNVGRDLPLQANAIGRRTYVVNAPPIHKFADETGSPVLGPRRKNRDGPKTASPHTAMRDCSDEYYRVKWGLPMKRAGQSKPRALDPGREAVLFAPTILVAPVGTIGPNWDGVPVASDGGFASAVFRTIVRKHRCPDPRQSEASIGDLRASAFSLLKRSGWPARWAFCVPGSELALDILLEAFPSATVVMPAAEGATTVEEEAACAALDSPIHQTLCRAAYDHMGLARETMLAEAGPVRARRVAAYRAAMVAEQAGRMERMPAPRRAGGGGGS